MAIGTIQVCGGLGAAAATVTTAAFTPASAGMRLFAFVGQRGSSEPNEPIVTDSTGLTWTKRLDTGTVTTPRLSLWTADVVTPTSMTVTADRNGSAVVIVHVLGLTGTANDFTNFGMDDDTVGDPSLSMVSLPAASSTVIAACLMGGGNALTPTPTGYTVALATSTGNRFSSYYDQTSAAQTLAWTTSNADAIALAVEIKEATGAQALTPGLTTNAQTFYAPTTSPGAVSLAPALLSNAQSFYLATVTASATLTPALLTNGQTFPASSVSASNTIAPALVSNIQTFPAALVTTGQVVLAPTLLASATTFFAPNVSGGAVNLTVGLLVNAQTFFGGTVASGATDLRPPLLANVVAFPQATVAPGAVSVIAPLLPAGSIFYSVALASNNSIAPPVAANDNGFFAAVVSVDGSGPSDLIDSGAKRRRFSGGARETIFAQPPRDSTFTARAHQRTFG